MIAIESRGRLGNHMFQFAFGLAAGGRLRTDFAMNVDLLRRSFTLGPYEAPLRRASRALRYRAGRRVAGYPLVKIEHTADPAAVLATLRDDTHYEGFFQSEQYFADAEADVRAAFTPLRAYRREFEERHRDLLARPYVCCHVRRTDYLTWGDGVALPPSYYRDCLELLAVDEQTPVVFVGDDLSEVETHLAAPLVRFERNAEAVDLLLLVHADAVVTSNSSFGWWGAWLGATGRPVLAPRHWLGFRAGTEAPPRIIPRSWTTVPVAVPTG